MTALPAEPFFGRKRRNITSLKCHFWPTYQDLRKKISSVCKIDVREDPESLVMTAATLKEISREEYRGGGRLGPPSGSGLTALT